MLPLETTLVLDLPDPDATSRLGVWLADRLGAGDVVALHGPIGSGKTHLARALIRHRLAAAGRDEDVPSPTFTLVQVYSDGRTEMWHADLYRLTTPREVVELGLDEAFERALCLVEWPDRLGSLMPPQALHLRLEAWGDGRRATLGGPSARMADLLETGAPDV
jgi:tRNA threonylcarbamoyladenosine biosynthesis protein TsaE